MSGPTLTPVVVVPTATLQGLLADAIHTEASLEDGRNDASESALEFAARVRATLERVLA
jgi:hypothetical protein